jgi:hypothetical protein
MLHHRMKLALAILAALVTAQGTAHAQDSGFGHFGTFSSAQGSAAQWSATAPGMYASGEYAYVGPFGVVYMGPSRPYSVRIASYNRRTIYVPSSYVPSGYVPSGYVPSSYVPSSYVPSSATSVYEPGLLPDYGVQPSVNAYGPGEERRLKELGRYNYDRGFRDGYNAGLSAAPARTETYQGNPFSSR